jgi:RecJ-like exonuclease
MDRRIFIAGLGALLASSCARDDLRPKAYDPTQCPFCSLQAGTCAYCKGTAKCPYCDGTGKRKTVWNDVAEENIKKGSYDDKCSFCKGTGKCQYCGGSAKCWACDGKGKINIWDFYEKFIAEKQSKGPAK